MQLKELSFEVIQRCPNYCIHCSSNSNSQSKHIISYRAFKQTIDDAVDLGLSRVCISGGEPFLHPDIMKFVQYAKEHKLEVFIYTSGITFNSTGNRDCIGKDVLEKLKAVGLDRVIFNVQSSDEDLYNTIMGTENCFDLMKTSIVNSVQSDLFCEIHFVPMKINFDRIDSVLEMAQELAVKKVSFLRLVLQGRALQNKHMVETTENINSQLKSMLNSLKEKYPDIDIRIGIPLSSGNTHRCNASFNKLIIRYDGAVFPCEAFKYICAIDGQKSVKPDNINTASLKDIYYNSEFISILRSEINEFKSHGVGCETCPAQWRLSKALTR